MQKIKPLFSLSAMLIFIMLCGGARAWEKNTLQNPNVYNILDYGAVKNKAVNSQSAIQQAIDACSDAGGGTVWVPSGQFATHTIRLKDNVNFHLDNGAILYALSDASLYKNEKEGQEDIGDSFIPGLIVAKKVKNIGISGLGTIMGQPEFFFSEVTEDDSYPGWNKNARLSGVRMMKTFVKDPKISLVYISECENVLIQDVSIIDSPNWSCHLQWSRHINIRGVKIRSSLEHGVNSDGLDIDGCKNVLISDCDIQTGDDAICLKTTRQGNRSESCEDISVNNCVLSSTSCALKIGTETYADFKRIMFTNCTISNSNRGIGIIVRDGATVDEVIFSNIVMDCKRKPFFWWGDGEAFHFNVVKRNKESKIGRIQNVDVRNILGKVEGSSTVKGFKSEGNNHYTSIGNINFSDIQLIINPESENDKRTVNGIDIQNSENITLNNVEVKWNLLHSEKKWKHALYAEDVRGLTVDKFRAHPTDMKSSYPIIHLNNIQQGYIEAPFFHLSEMKKYVRITGPHTLNILVKTYNRMYKK